MEFLEKTVYGDFTVLHVAIAVGGLFVLVVLFKILFGGRSEGGGHMDNATCPNCGWSGVVSQYNRTCKGCNSPMP